MTAGVLKKIKTHKRLKTTLKKSNDAKLHIFGCSPHSSDEQVIQMGHGEKVGNESVKNKG